MPSKKESVHIGSVNDSFESLKAMCNDKTYELIKTIQLAKGEKMQIIFWTDVIHEDDIPELIGIANVERNDTGVLTYTMDYSVTTL